MNKQKKIILIRHGETVWNAQERFQGKTDIELSETGKKQALLLAERMRVFDVDVVYSSPLSRAIDTAKPFAEQKGLKVIKSDTLREIDFGHWEGLTLREIRAGFPDEYEKCRGNPVKYGFHYGLTFNEVKETVGAFIDEYIELGTHENVAIVAHSVIIKMLLVVLLDLPPEHFHTFYLSNGSISVIALSEKRKVLLKFNDTAHIDLGAHMLF